MFSTIRAKAAYSKLIEKCVRETKGTSTPVRAEHLLRQKGWERGGAPYWPVHETSVITGWKNIYCGIETCPGFMPGCYIQAINPIFIGNYSRISANVGLISANHEPTDLRKHIPSVGIKIGEYCWIGMNVVVLPNVELGDFAIVGAGSIVTKSFSEGYCIIAGNPARKIRELNANECIRYSSDKIYYGFIPAMDFPFYRKKYLNI